MKGCASEATSILKITQTKSQGGLMQKTEIKMWRHVGNYMDEIVDQLMSGKNLHQVCQQEGFPAPSEVIRCALLDEDISRALELVARFRQK